MIADRSRFNSLTLTSEDISFLLIGTFLYILYGDYTPNLHHRQSRRIARWPSRSITPAIYHIDDTGVLINRYVPDGTAALAGQPVGTYGDEAIPFSAAGLSSLDR
jgi:hypothetical protein